jgi:hypothetical protein
VWPAICVTVTLIGVRLYCCARVMTLPTPELPALPAELAERSDIADAAELSQRTKRPKRDGAAPSHQHGSRVAAQ